MSAQEIQHFIEKLFVFKSRIPNISINMVMAQVNIQRN